MRIDRPSERHTAALKQLWTEAFGEPDFWDRFMESVFEPVHCRCVFIDDAPVAALYLLDCALHDQRVAYLYAIATDTEHRNQGLCRQLMADTHAHLRSSGFSAALLVPADEGLAKMYAGFGYSFRTSVHEFTCAASEPPMALRPIDRAEYARLRSKLLPDDSIVQEDANLTLLETMTGLWTGDGCLLAAAVYADTLHVQEYLGDPSAAPAITRALGCTKGIFRTPGSGKPFAMCLPLIPDFTAPAYFGLAFD